jgi:cell wall assembly regulator SMI1
MSHVRSLLLEIANELLLLGVDVSRNLNSGASPVQIQQACEGLPFQLPPEVCDLFMWRNGIKEGDFEGEFRLLPRFCFRTVQESAKTSRQFSKTFGDSDEAWRSSWFYLFNDLAGDFLAYDTDPSLLTGARIIAVRHGLGTHSAFCSLEQMLSGVLECYRTGAYFLDEDGFLIDDERLADLIFKKTNNGLSPYSDILDL